jgi:hypothetical protein
MTIVSDLIRQTTESYSSIRTTQYINPSDNTELLLYPHNTIYLQREQPVCFSTLGTAKG